MIGAEEPDTCELFGTGVDSRYLVPVGIVGPSYYEDSDIEGWICYVIAFVTDEAPLEEEFWVALNDGRNVLDI